MPNAREALDRTLRLMRDHVCLETQDRTLVNALTDVRVLLIADRANLATANGQHALATTALLAARAGAQVFYDIPNVPLMGVQPPLVGLRLLDALLEIGADLIPGQIMEAQPPRGDADVTIVLGDTPWRSGALGRTGHAVRLIGGAWRGAMRSVGSVGERWRDCGSPFGALAAAGLGAIEVYKAALRAVAHHAIVRDVFDSLFTPVTVADIDLAPSHTPIPSRTLGAVDFVSGGAITQAALYALARIPGVRACARVIEPEKSELSNINRYALLRRSRLGMRKVDDLASLDLGAISMVPMAVRYDEANAGLLLPFASTTVVGVDHIPTRWAIQRAHSGWLGVGATDHYLAVASFHTPATACAGCLHPVDAPAGTAVPTLAVVSHWAGLWVAALLARHVSGEKLSPLEQSNFTTTLRSDLRMAVWRVPVPRSVACPVSCSTRAA